MSMPYHKELLRSSVSLCFREFFVFRNKAKGVMTLLCQFEKMIYPSGTGAADAASFMIALYRPCEKLKDSSGNTITQIKAVGYRYTPAAFIAATAVLRLSERRYPTQANAMYIMSATPISTIKRCAAGIP